jgi:hypothetical protein
LANRLAGCFFANRLTGPEDTAFGKTSSNAFLKKNQYLVFWRVLGVSDEPTSFCDTFNEVARNLIAHLFRFACTTKKNEEVDFLAVFNFHGKPFLAINFSFHRSGRSYPNDFFPLALPNVHFKLIIS